MPIIEGDFKRFDLPPEERCWYCGRKATRLCDADGGIVFDMPNDKGIKTPIQRTTCSIPMCDKCTTKFGELDFCKRHAEELKNKLKSEHKEEL